jgi:ABC-2 type transport system ATP-binding protein
MSAIEVKNLTKKYPNTTALDDISFSIKKGEFFGLLGPNGAGKTTTINILTGLCNKTSGTVTLFGKDVVQEYREARALIGLVPQEFNFDKFEKVYNILFFNAGYFGIPEKKRPKRIETVLKELGLWEKRFSKAMELSGGMKRKLMIARALIHQPRILILDEPTAGVDVETRKSMWKYISKLQNKGITILLTTHYIEEAEELCERIAIINNGEIIKLDSKKNLLNLLGQEKIVIHLKEPPQKIPPSLEKYHADTFLGDNRFLGNHARRG